MAVVLMRKLRLCGLKKERKQIIQAIQRLGVIELAEEPLRTGMMRMDTVSAARQLWEQVELAEQAIGILEESDKGSIDETKDTMALLADKEEIISRIHRILQNRESYGQIQKQLSQLEKQITELKRWEALSCPMGLTETADAKIRFGIFPGSLKEEEIYALLHQKEGDNLPVQIHVIFSDKYQTGVGVVSHKSVAEKVYERLREENMMDAPKLTEQIPKEAMTAYEEEEKKLTRQIHLLAGELSALSDSLQNIRAYADESRARAVKYEALGELNQSKYCFFLQGYIPENQVKVLEEALTDFTVQTETVELSEGEELPVLLENNTAAEPLEGVVSSYGLPNSNEFDPTGIMAVFYYVFFGIMLSDAAYGLLISLVCLFLLRRMPDKEGSFAKSVRMFFYCGISTMIWGILFGSYFGDLAAVLSEKTGLQLAVRPLWFAPLDDPMRMLMYSMLFGVIHLFTGLGCKGYLLLKERRIGDFFCDVGLWYLLLTGLLILLLPSEIFTAISGVRLVLPGWLVWAGSGMAWVGAIGLLFFAGRKSKNAGIRLALGACALYNITGWLSDVLSYSRLLALGLATGVIASVINTMAGMVGDGIVGAVGFLLIFIIGHAFNIAVNLLGAYVHTNRLQYVEFFGKFYTGGGRAFAPFTEERQYNR